MKKTKLNIYDIGMFWLIAVGLFNTSSYGASFSWIIFPAAIIILYVFFMEKKLNLRVMHLYAVLFYVITVVSTLFSSIIAVKRDIITSFLFVILFIIITGTKRMQINANLFVKCYMLVAFLGAIDILYNFINGVYYNTWFQRSTVVFMGVARDPNYVGAFIAPFPIMMMVFRPFKNSKHEFFINIVTICISMIALIVDGSRGSIIPAVLSLFIYYWIQIKNIKTKTIILMLTIIIIFLGRHLIIQYLPEQTIERLLFLQSGDTRTDLWSSALKGFMNNPIIGQGMGAASYYSMLEVGNYSHNMYIDLLSGSGILGVLWYILVLKNAIFGSKKNRVNQMLIAIALFMPQFFINGYNTLSMWLPIIITYCCKVVLEQGELVYGA